MSAEWRRIPGFSMYEVAPDGQVRSWRKLGGTRLLRGHRRANGYRYLCLVDDRGETQIKGLHVLVAEAFLGPRPAGEWLVRHLDGDPSNNVASNLAFGTQSQNQDDSVRHGTHAHARKSACKRGHEFTPANTRIEVRGDGRTARHCRTCIREADLARGNRPH